MSASFPLFRAGVLLLAAACPPVAASADDAETVAQAAVQAAVQAAADGAHAGLVVLEGDILVGPRLGTRGVSLPAARTWANGEVPYVLDPSLGAGAARAVEAAVTRWNALAGITLERVADGGDVPRDHLVFQPGPGCASWVGRQGGAQEVWIGASCSSGSVMHEIGHALGLEHEHTRPDRDAHVRVNWERIVPEKRHNFELAPADARLLGDYDLGSIMHYGPSNFSVDGRPTLEPLDPAAGARMGQRDAPSAGDIAAIARLYASDLALVAQPDEEPLAAEVTLYVSNEHPQGAHDIVVTLAAAGLDVVTWSGDGWRCANGVRKIAADDGDALVRCRLARLEGEAASRVTLGFGTPLAAATLRAALTSKTPDLDPSDNGSLGSRPVSAAAPPFMPTLGAARGTLADAPASGIVAAENGDGRSAGAGTRTAGVASDGAAGGGGAACAVLGALLLGTLGTRRRTAPGVRYCVPPSSGSSSRKPLPSLGGSVSAPSPAP